MPDNKKAVTPLKLFKAFMTGAIVMALFIAINAVPKALHKKWLELGSAYDVEYEFLYSNIIRQVREALYTIGIDSDTYVGGLFRDLQQHQVDKAFTKIPESDGERILWQYDADVDFTLQVSKNKNVSEIMPRVLKTFDELTSVSMSSKWMGEIHRYQTANRLAGFFFSNLYKSGLKDEDLKYWSYLVVNRMYEISSKLNEKFFVSDPHQFTRLVPIIWKDQLLAGSSRIIYNPITRKFNCDPNIIKIVLETKKKLKFDFPFYKAIANDALSKKWINAISSDLDADTEEVISKYCPNYKQ